MQKSQTNFVLPKFILFFLLSFSSAAIVWASSTEERDAVIEKKLACVSQNFNHGKDVQWADICATEAPKPQGDGREELIDTELQAAEKRIKDISPEQSQESYLKIQNSVRGDLDEVRKQFEATAADKEPMVAMDELPTHKDNPAVKDVEPSMNSNAEVMDRPVKDMESFEKHEKGPHSFELGGETYAYKYTERIGVKITSFKTGLIGAYQYRPFENETSGSLDDLLHDKIKINIFRLEGRLSYGEVKYEGSGTWDGIPDWNFESRGLVGMEIPVDEDLVFTPYSGLGYRYLFNESSQIPAQTINGQDYYSGYDRESFYIYIPLGLEVKKQMDEKWSWGVKSEFDFFVWGKQISHFEDMVDNTGASANIDKLENTQKHGMGWRLSGRLTRHTGRFDIFVEPFVRFWHIEDSQFEFVTSGGGLLCNGNLCQGGIEPDNKTWETGVNLGAKF